MKETITKFIIFFGLFFLLVNAIGYIFNINSFVTVLKNPNGYGGFSKSNIPTILSFLLTTFVIMIRKFKNKWGYLWLF